MELRYNLVESGPPCSEAIRPGFFEADSDSTNELHQVPVKENLNSTAYKNILYNSVL